MPVTRLRVLLSEASSLTAREHLTVLGAAGVQVEAMSSDRFALCRWSRWARRLHHCPAPGTDPAGYLQAVSAVLAEGGFDALLPTHEQAWLFAVARDRLPPAALVAGRRRRGARADPLPVFPQIRVQHRRAGRPSGTDTGRTGPRADRTARQWAGTDRPGTGGRAVRAGAGLVR